MNSRHKGRFPVQALTLVVAQGLNPQPCETKYRQGVASGTPSRARKKLMPQNLPLGELVLGDMDMAAKWAWACGASGLLSLVACGLSQAVGPVMPLRPCLEGERARQDCRSLSWGGAARIDALLVASPWQWLDSRARVLPMVKREGESRVAVPCLGLPPESLDTASFGWTHFNRCLPLSMFACVSLSLRIAVIMERIDRPGNGRDCLSMALNPARCFLVRMGCIARSVQSSLARPPSYLPRRGCNWASYSQKPSAVPIRSSQAALSTFHLFSVEVVAV